MLPRSRAVRTSREDSITLSFRAVQARASKRTEVQDLTESADCVRRKRTKLHGRAPNFKTD